MAEAAGRLVYYFAYGSNMNPQRMRERGVTFCSREPARLPGQRLAFNKRGLTLPRGAGYANVVPDRHGVVEGALYRMDRSQLAALDECEGWPRHYRREEMEVERADGSRVTAIVYVAQPGWTRPGLRPTREYLDHLLAGRDVLSPAYQRWLAAVPVIQPSRPSARQARRGMRRARARKKGR